MGEPNLMMRYETLLLVKTQATEDDFSMIEQEFDKLVSTAKGTFSLFDKWGKYRLCYPVSGQTNGMYILVRYELPAEKIASVSITLNNFLKIKCNEIVMRYVTIRLQANAPSQYQRPDPLDTSPGGSLNSLKDNKIENLLNSVSGSHDHYEHGVDHMSGSDLEE